MLDVRTVIVPANASLPVPLTGSYAYVRSSTAAAVGLGFDGQPVQVCIAGEGYPAQKPFHTIQVVDLLGAGTTVTLVVSDMPMVTPGGLTPASVAAMTAALTALVNRLAGVATMTQAVVGPLPVAPVAGIVLRAANANRRRIAAEGSHTNIGKVLLGKAAGNCLETDNCAALVAGQPWSDDYYTGAIYAAGTDAADTVSIYEL